MTQPDWRRLGEAVIAARVALGMTTREHLATAAGFSVRLLGDIENGRRTNYDAITLMRLERALKWAPGSAEHILAGGDPTHTDDPTAAADDDTDELEFEISMILRSDLPEPQKQAMVDYARDLQRRQRDERRALVDRQRSERRSAIQRVMDIARGGTQHAT